MKHKRNYEEDHQIWMRRVDGEQESVLFATSFLLPNNEDLRGFAKTLPAGVVVCDSSIIAGIKHIESILLQTREYWKRNQRLVRNGSIEILMRLTCRSQITDAIETSGIKETNSVVLLGLVSSEIDVEDPVKTFLIKFEQANQDLELLAMNGEKAKKLKKIHGFSSALTRDQLLAALQERSVLLIFSK